MPTRTINGANIYYEVLGKERSCEIPILLIHGSTITGQEDWGTVGPILARKRMVIVPDCRGHGRSDNPNSTYSFRQMAADLAALVRELGYERVHVIGHSNGGNVALVMLVEHPDVVQTAIPQAANAYVDDFLREREPGVFDPERIARESPQWLEQMERLHGPYHEPDYVRKLLALTLKEIISEPNYTPAVLSKVERPTLVIQGAGDPVNAPSYHGQFIARHIPFAEMWIPKGVQHNVHAEVTAEWIARVERFLDQRGDPANEALFRLGYEAYADERDWVYELHAVKPSDPADRLLLSGQVLYAEQLAEAVKRVAAEVEIDPAQIDTRAVQVLITDETPWALASRAISDLRHLPGILNERHSQLLLGEAVRVLGEDGEWSWVRMERDGYLGWVQTAGLHAVDAAQVIEYQAGCRHRVQAELLPAWIERSEAGDPFLVRHKLPFGARIMVTQQDGKYAEICLPDGSRRWVAMDGLLPVERRPKPDAAGIADALRLMRRVAGVPYQWGGRTASGYDCSGLAGTLWEWLGVTLKRDADQQFRLGSPVEGEPQPGDLLFFGEPAPEKNLDRHEHITHVAISLGGDRVLHATGAYWATVYNSLDPNSPDYRAWLRENLVGIRRYNDANMAALHR